jgi:GNAT superfamily N-acetyltransferase
VHIRIATEADIPAMHRIRMDVRENRLSDPSRVQPDDYRPYLSGRGRGWLAELDGQVAGFAVADLQDASVWALFVDPAFEGRGAGRQLHDVMVDWLFASGAARIRLGTGEGTRAERFYRRAGWQEAGREASGELRFELSREGWRSGRGA